MKTKTSDGVCAKCGAECKECRKARKSLEKRIKASHSYDDFLAVMPYETLRTLKGCYRADEVPEHIERAIRRLETERDGMP